MALRHYLYIRYSGLTLCIQLLSHYLDEFFQMFTVEHPVCVDGTQRRNLSRNYFLLGYDH